MDFRITRENQRGAADHGWLRAKHYFSFASYYNPERMGFGKLLVINDDVVAAGTGFGTHPHSDMEIITIPQNGAVSHKDSFGNEGKISKGEVQVMSAGTGIRHSEFNKDAEELNLFQIWIQPNERGVEPRYDQMKFDYGTLKDKWVQLISPMDRPGEKGLKIYQNAYINAASITEEKSLFYQAKTQGSGLYLLVVEGEVEVSGQKLTRRDAIEITDASEITVQAYSESEVILIEVPL